MNHPALAILQINFLLILATFVSTSANYRKEWNLLTLIEQKYKMGFGNTDTDFAMNLTGREHSFQFPAQTLFPELMITNDAFFFIKLIPASTAFTILAIRDPLDSIKLNIRAYEKRDQFNQFRLSILYNTDLFGQDEYRNETEITVPFINAAWTLGILFENQKLTVYTNCDDVSNPFGYHQSSDRALINKKFFDSGATLFLFNNGDVNGNKERFEGTVSEFVLTSKKKVEEFMCQKEIPEGSGMFKKTWKQKNIGNYLITESTTESSSTDSIQNKVSRSNKLFSNHKLRSPGSNEQTSSFITKSLLTKWSSKIPKVISFPKSSSITVPKSTTISTKTKTLFTTTRRKYIKLSKIPFTSKDLTTKSEKLNFGTIRPSTTTTIKTVNFTDTTTSQKSINTSKTLQTTTKKPTNTFENYKDITPEESISTTKNSTIYKNVTIFKILSTTTKNPTIKSEKSTTEESTSTKHLTSYTFLTTISKTPSTATKIQRISNENYTTGQSTVTTKLSKPITKIHTFINISIAEKPTTIITTEQLPNTISTKKPIITNTTIQNFITTEKSLRSSTSTVKSTIITNSTDDSITLKNTSMILSKKHILEKDLSKFSTTLLKGEKAERVMGFNDSECDCQANLRFNIPEKGSKGTQGSKGLKGEKGNAGMPGINGTCLTSRCTQISSSNSVKGDKGDIGYCSIESCKINRFLDKGEKGNKGERGAKGESGDGLKLSELVQILLPEVKSTIDDFVSRNIINMKGEPGTCSCPSEIIKEEGKIKTQTLILNDARNLKSSSLTMPVGQMVFLIVENILLIKIDEVKNRWRVVKLENAETDWYFAIDTPNSQSLQQTAGQPMFNTAFKLMLIALPKPTGGDLRSDPFEPGAYSGSSYLCQKQAYNYGLGRAFYPLLNTDMFDFNYILPEKYRYGVPVVNRRNEKIALSFADLLKPSVEIQANILDFRGDSIMSETNEPCVWIGEKPSLHEDKNLTEEGLCLNWMSKNSKNSAKVTFLKLNKPFLNPSQIKAQSCNTMCYILCMQIYPLMSEVRKR